MENEKEHGGDPITFPEPKTRKRRRPGLLALVLVLVAGISLANSAIIFGAFRQTFPTSQLFTVSFAYQRPRKAGKFTNENPNAILVPGDSLEGTLTVVSAAKSATTLKISFNATNPAEWANGDVFGVCGVGPEPLTMIVGGVQILPENSPKIGTQCDSGIFATVTIQPGPNLIATTISAKVDASPGSFTLAWFANV